MILYNTAWFFEIPIVQAVSFAEKSMKKEKHRKFVRLKNGKRISKTFDRLTDAKHWLSHMNVEKKKNDLFGFDTPMKIKFKDLASDWFSIKKNTIELKSAYEYEAILNKHILPEFKDSYLTDLRKIDAEKFVISLVKKNLSSSRIKKIYVLLKGLITYALNHNYIVRDPFLGVTLPKIKEKKRDYLETSEVQALLDSAFLNDQVTFGIILLTVNLGLRLGEALGLHWDQIDFSRKRIYLRRSATRFGIQEFTKHGKHRTVFMNDTVFDFLKELHIKQPFQKFVFNDSGVAIDYEHFKQRRFDKIVAAAGLRRIKFHSLRHTFASHFVMSGGRIQELQPLLGHNDIKTTMIYAHVSESHLEKLASVVEFGKQQKNALDKIEKAK